MFKFLTVLTFLFNLNLLAYATEQYPDYLITKGDTIEIYINPLEQYFKQIGTRDLKDFVGCGSTACWRGYKAIWELKENRLLLRSVISCHNKCGLEIKDADLVKMFGRGDVLANWFTGHITLPKGKLVNTGLWSIYENQETLSFKKGLLKSVKTKSNKKTIDKAIADFRARELTKKSLDTIFYHIKINIDWERLDNTKYMCDDEYLLTFNKDGEIKKVKFPPIPDTVNFKITAASKIDNWIYNFTESRCRREIKNSLKNLKLDYLKPKSRFTVEIEMFYKTDEKLLELWKPHWINDNE